MDSELLLAVTLSQSLAEKGCLQTDEESAQVKHFVTVLLRSIKQFLHSDANLETIRAFSRALIECIKLEQITRLTSLCLSQLLLLVASAIVNADLSQAAAASHRVVLEELCRSCLAVAIRCLECTTQAALPCSFRTLFHHTSSSQLSSDNQAMQEEGIWGSLLRCMEMLCCGTVDRPDHKFTCEVQRSLEASIPLCPRALVLVSFLVHGEEVSSANSLSTSLADVSQGRASDFLAGMSQFFQSETTISQGLELKDLQNSNRIYLERDLQGTTRIFRAFAAHSCFNEIHSTTSPEGRNSVSILLELLNRVIDNLCSPYDSLDPNVAHAAASLLGVLLHSSPLPLPLPATLPSSAAVSSSLHLVPASLSPEILKKLLQLVQVKPGNGILFRTLQAFIAVRVLYSLDSEKCAITTNSQQNASGLLPIQLVLLALDMIKPVLWKEGREKSISFDEPLSFPLFGSVFNCNEARSLEQISTMLLKGPFSEDSSNLVNILFNLLLFSYHEVALKKNGRQETSAPISESFSPLSSAIPSQIKPFAEPEEDMDTYSAVQDLFKEVKCQTQNEESDCQARKENMGDEDEDFALLMKIIELLDLLFDDGCPQHLRNNLHIFLCPEQIDCFLLVCSHQSPLIPSTLPEVSALGPCVQNADLTLQLRKLGAVLVRCPWITLEIQQHVIQWQMLNHPRFLPLELLIVVSRLWTRLFADKAGQQKWESLAKMEWKALLNDVCKLMRLESSMATTERHAPSEVISLESILLFLQLFHYLPTAERHEIVGFVLKVLCTSQCSSNIRSSLTIHRLVQILHYLLCHVDGPPRGFFHSLKENLFSRDVLSISPVHLNRPRCFNISCAALFSNVLKDLNEKDPVSPFGIAAFYDLEFEEYPCFLDSYVCSAQIFRESISSDSALSLLASSTGFTQLYRLLLVDCDEKCDIPLTVRGFFLRELAFSTAWKLLWILPIPHCFISPESLLGEESGNVILFKIVSLVWLLEQEKCLDRGGTNFPALVGSFVNVLERLKLNLDPVAGIHCHRQHALISILAVLLSSGLEKKKSGIAKFTMEKESDAVVSLLGADGSGEERGPKKARKTSKRGDVRRRRRHRRASEGEDFGGYIFDLLACARKSVSDGWDVFHPPLSPHSEEWNEGNSGEGLSSSHGPLGLEEIDYVNFLDLPGLHVGLVSAISGRISGSIDDFHETLGGLLQSLSKFYIHSLENALQPLFLGDNSVIFPTFFGALKAMHSVVEVRALLPSDDGVASVIGTFTTRQFTGPVFSMEKTASRTLLGLLTSLPSVREAPFKVLIATQQRCLLIVLGLLRLSFQSPSISLSSSSSAMVLGGSLVQPLLVLSCDHSFSWIRSAASSLLSVVVGDLAPRLTQMYSAHLSCCFLKELAGMSNYLRSDLNKLTLFKSAAFDAVHRIRELSAVNTAEDSLPFIEDSPTDIIALVELVFCECPEDLCLDLLALLQHLCSLAPRSISLRCHLARHLLDVLAASASPTARPPLGPPRPSLFQMWLSLIFCQADVDRRIVTGSVAFLVALLKPPLSESLDSSAPKDVVDVLSELRSCLYELMLRQVIIPSITCHNPIPALDMGFFLVQKLAVWQGALPDLLERIFISIFQAELPPLGMLGTSIPPLTVAVSFVELLLKEVSEEVHMENDVLEGKWPVKEADIAGKLCTYTVTKSNFVEQPWYYCYTCRLVCSEGCCSICVRRCHRGHDISFSRKSRFYCDCGAGGTLAGGEHCQAMEEAHSGRTAEKEKSDQGSRQNDSGEVDLQKKDAGSVAGTSLSFGLQGKEVRLLREALKEHEDMFIATTIKIWQWLLPSFQSASECLHLPASAGRKEILLGSKKILHEKLAVHGRTKIVSFEAESGDLKALFSILGISCDFLCCSSKGLVLFAEGNFLSIVGIDKLLERIEKSEGLLKLSSSSGGSDLEMMPSFRVMLPFAITGLRINSTNEDILCVIGLRDCHVLQFSSSRFEVLSEVVVSLDLPESAVLLDVQWLSGGETFLAAVTNSQVRIYDISYNVQCPQVTLVMDGNDSIRSAAFSSDGCGLVSFVFSRSGKVYWHRHLFGTSMVDQLDSVIPISSHFGSGEPLSAHYSPPLNVLILSYRGGKCLLLALDARFTYSGAACPVVLCSDREGEEGSPGQIWREIPGETGAWVSTSVDSPDVFVVRLNEGSVKIQRLRLREKAKEKALTVGLAICPTRPHLLLVFRDNGSLHFFDLSGRSSVVVSKSRKSSHRPPFSSLSSALRLLGSSNSPRLSRSEMMSILRGTYDIASPEQPEQPEEESSANQDEVRLKDRKKKELVRIEKPDGDDCAPVDYFEQVENITSDITIAGEIIAAYSPSTAKHLLCTTDEYLVSRSGRMHLRIVNKDSRRIIVGIRLLLGHLQSDAIPSRINIFNREIATVHGQRRWYDVPFTVEEIFSTSREVEVVLETPSGNRVVLDGLEVYGMTKRKFMWKERFMRILSQSNESLFVKKYEGIQGLAVCVLRFLFRTISLHLEVSESLIDIQGGFSLSDFVGNLYVNGVSGQILHLAKCLLRIQSSTKESYLQRKCTCITRAVNRALISLGGQLLSPQATLRIVPLVDRMLHHLHCSFFEQYSGFPDLLITSFWRLSVSRVEMAEMVDCSAALVRILWSYGTYLAGGDATPESMSFVFDHILSFLQCSFNSIRFSAIQSLLLILNGKTGTENSPNSMNSKLAGGSDICLRYYCDQCNQQLTRGRWQCEVCPDFHLCRSCARKELEYKRGHSMDHAMSYVLLDGSSHVNGSEDVTTPLGEAVATDFIDSLVPPGLDVDDEETLLKLAVDLSLREDPTSACSTTLTKSEKNEEGGSDVAMVDAEEKACICPDKQSAGEVLQRRWALEYLLRVWPQTSAGGGLHALPTALLLCRLARDAGSDTMTRLVDVLLLHSREPISAVRSLVAEGRLLGILVLCSLDTPAEVSKSHPGDAVTPVLQQVVAEKTSALPDILRTLAELLPVIGKSGKESESSYLRMPVEGRQLRLSVPQNHSLLPIFDEEYASKHAGDLFEEYQQLLAKGLLRLGILLHGVKGLEVARWIEICSRYVSGRGCTVAVRRVARLLLHLLLPEEHRYHEEKEFVVLDEVFRKIRNFSQRSSMLSQVVVHKKNERFIRALVSVKVSSSSLQGYNMRNPDFVATVFASMGQIRPDSELEYAAVPYLINFLAAAFSKIPTADVSSFLVVDSEMSGEDEKAAQRKLKDGGTGEEVITRKRKKEKRDKKKKYIQNRMEQLEGGLSALVQLVLENDFLSDFVNRFLLKCNVSSIRQSSRLLLENVWKRAKSSQRAILRGVILAKLEEAPSGGRNSADFMKLLRILLEEHEAGTADDVLGRLFSCLRSCNQILSTHPNSTIYPSLGRYLDLEGYFLESQPCLVCNAPEMSFVKTALDTIKEEVRYTDCTQIVKFVTPLTIRGLHISISNIRSVRMVKKINLYCNSRTVADIGDLKDRWSLWTRIYSCELKPNQSEFEAVFFIPVTASNFLVEYAAFHQTLTAGTVEKLECPRCSRVVTDRHGLCKNCRENAFQCRQCRNINYENLEAFLCNECGYCKYGRFEYTLMVRPSLANGNIETPEEQKKALERIEEASGNAHDRYQHIKSLKEPLVEILDKL